MSFQDELFFQGFVDYQDHKENSVNDNPDYLSDETINDQYYEAFPEEARKPQIKRCC